MKKIVFIALCIFPFLTFAQDTLVKWTFPNNPDDSVADGGIAANLNRTIRGIGCGTVGYINAGFTTYSARATGWDNGAGTKYWQVMFSTAGYDSLYFSSKQRASDKGPKHFKIQWKIGSLGTWTDVPNATVIDTSFWTQVITDTLDPLCNNTDSVFMRWIMIDNVSVDNGTVASVGAASIDDIFIWGHNISGIIPPVVTNAFITDLSTLKVVFSKAVNTTAEATTNYTFTGGTVSTAVRSALLDTVTLTLAAPMTNGDATTLTIQNVQDIMGTPMAAPQSFNFLYNNSIADLVITEIMYNDPSSVSDSLEFIELYNNSSSAALVGGYQFKHGIITPTLLYSFPASTTLAPNSYVVYAKKINAVNNFFNITSTIQWISGQSLANTTDRIQILNTVGNIIDSLTYKTTAPWPTTPNGNGPSLTLCDPTLDNSVGSNWQASAEYVDSLNNKPVFATPGTGCITTNIEDHSVNNYSVNYFPNPVSEVLTLTLDEQVKEIIVFDIIGNIVYKTSKLSSVITINTEKLNDGIYFIKIIFNDNTIITRKISVI